MFLFSTAKQNLMAGFKARFTWNADNKNYLFYPKEYEKGYQCLETDYLKYTSDFSKFLKLLSRTMWIWFLVFCPIAIGLAIWQEYEFSTLEKLIIIMFPLPFLFRKGLKIYNVPHELMTHKPIAKPRTTEQIQNDRIRGMSWLMLILMLIIPAIGILVFINDDSLLEWQVSLGICDFVLVFAFGSYLIWKKWKIGR